MLPKDDALLLKLRPLGIAFYSGDLLLAEVSILSERVMQVLAESKQVGVIEAENGPPVFPTYITAVATVRDEGFATQAASARRELTSAGGGAVRAEI